ncbi:MAG: hypothetical protein Q7S34_00345 [bacterium]|nr:hypothetical protein [bacterium]
MNNKYIPLVIIVGAVFVSVFIIENASAQTDSSAPDTTSIVFPIAELGDCKSKAECKAYCDQPNNMDACIAFAEKNNLMPKEEIEMAKKFLAVGGRGPGGCTGKDSCETYCNDMNNIDACVAFAEQSGMMPQKELDEAKKVQAAIKRGVKPPACGGKKACDAYCEDPNHIEECIAFASEAGFMSAEEQANAQKMVRAIKSGVKPLPCKGREECDAYCGQEQNIDQCVAFSEAAGFMSKDEATMAKKTRGKGPGGCQGKEQCEAFCNNPDNQESCFSFGKENGMITPEELQKMDEGNKQFRDVLLNAPPEVAGCLENRLGQENIEKLKSGGMRPTREFGDKMSECFRQGDEEHFQKEGQNGESNQGPEGADRRGPQNPGKQNNYEPSDSNKGPGMYEPNGPDEKRGMMPTNNRQSPPNRPGNFEERHSDDFQEGRPQYDQNYQPGNYQPQPGSGGYPCQGENCSPPPAGMQMPQTQQMQQGQMEPRQEYFAPGTDYPTGDTGGGQIQNPESFPPPPTGGDIVPMEPTSPAPAPTSFISPNLMLASVINFLRPLFFVQQ